MWRPSAEEASAAAERFGSPFYAYDFSVAIRRVEALRAAAEGELDVWYALKANPGRALLAALEPHVDGADVASEGELAQALASGFDGARVGFTGPGKGEAAHRAALAVGCLVSVESLGELEDLGRLAKEEGRVARVMLRVNPAERRHAFRVATGGVAGPFGIDEADLDAALACVGDLGAVVDCEGVHVHAGSGCSSAGAWHRHAVATLDLAARAAQGGLRLRRVNLGGGLSTPREGLDVPALGRKLAGTVRRFRAHFPKVRVVCEPGRYLVADVGCFVARVVRRVRSRGTTIVVLDGGLNAFLFATERFHDGPPPEVYNLSRPEGVPQPVTLVGPACTPLDTLGRGLEVPDPRPGDQLALGPAGAYGFSASPYLFLGHVVPAELVWEGGAPRCVRPRRKLAAFD